MHSFRSELELDEIGETRNCGSWLAVIQASMRRIGKRAGKEFECACKPSDVGINRLKMFSGQLRNGRAPRGALGTNGWICIDIWQNVVGVDWVEWVGNLDCEIDGVGRTLY